MKNYGHTWQWGDNPEYTVNVCTHWDRWALPLSIDWNRFTVQYSNSYNFGIHFLCFSFSLEIWRWNR